MIKLHISASEKIGTNNYGSIGAQCSLEIELDSRLADEAGALHEAITRYQQIATAAMREHLGRMVSSAGQTAHAKPAAPTSSATAAPTTNGKPGNGPAPTPTSTANGKPSAPTQQHHAQNGKATKVAPEPDPEFVEYDEAEESYTPEDDHDEDAPTTGRELLGWARRQSEDAFPWLIKTGRKLRFPERILDWSQEQVGKAYAAYRNAHSDN
jgi:hypothetical protein